MAEFDLSDRLFAQIADFLQRKTGIALKDYKKYLVVNRLSSLIGEGRAYPSFEGFFEALLRETDGTLLQSFINALTTNYSYFFRDPIHFQTMAHYLRERGPDESTLRFWSAASSTGEEAFSMAMTLANHGPGLTPNQRILATDISTKVLGIGLAGTYPAEALVRHVDPADMKRYFDPHEGGRFQVRASLRALVDFRLLNLLEAFPFRKQLDIVFLRNVMIYFGPQEKAEVVNKVHQVLKPGGLLFIGLSESLAGLPHRFRTYRDSIFMKTDR